MKTILYRTPGELIDESSKQSVRYSRAHIDTPDSIYLGIDLLRELSGMSQQSVTECLIRLIELNGQIWDAIDTVTAFDLSKESDVPKLREIVEVAQQVQVLNARRTRLIRQIDQSCRAESNTPEKVHKQHE